MKTLAKVLENIYQADSVVVISRGLSVRIADSFARDLQFLDVKAVSLYQDNMQNILVNCLKYFSCWTEFVWVKQN
ncbi:hypothetical protein LLCC_2642 [Lactococcus cremoris]|nr:hypothetical protein LLCC_2642 [Lactococcus cremoris]